MKRRSGRRRTTSKAPTPLAALMREQGRSYVWLARVTGYSTTHCNAVANGREAMTVRFAKLAGAALGVTEEGLGG